MGRIIIVCLLISVSTNIKASWYTQSKNMMGTRAAITLWCTDSVKAEAIFHAAFQEIRRLEKMLSPYIETSELVKVNQEAWKKPVSVSNDFFTLLQSSLRYSHLTDGAFDISFASVGRFYDFRKHQKPAEQDINQHLRAINYRLIILNKTYQSVFLKSKLLKIDLGGIAKGYTTDQVAVILKKKGVLHASISIGGDSRIIGDRQGRPWMIGIKSPRGDEPVVAVLPLENVALSTSGDYERYFMDSDDGERVHHILNPATGKSTSEVQSASVIGPLGRDTDPLSTSIFVLGAKRGIELINKLPDFDAVIIDQQGHIHYSDGLMAPLETK